MPLELAFIDKAIILSYLVVVMAIGVILSKVASKGVDDYFLGGRSIPWWVLGASGTASNFDMTGTMVIVSMIFVLGFKGFWVEMRGGVALPLAFLMAFMGKWTRRSKCMTSAEWMIYRYGDGHQGRSARVLSTIAYLILSVGMVAYFCVGTGTFLEQFLPWNRHVCSAVMVVIGLAYTLLSGLYGVVFTDIVQEIVITITAIYISVKAYFLYDPAIIPEGWTAFEMPYKLDLTGLPESYQAFEMFGLCVLFWIGKAVLEGTGGLGGYMAQRYFAARNEKEAGLMTAEWITLLGFRWTMIAGLALMGLHLAASDPGIAGILTDNPERVLPIVLQQMLPEGLRGMAIAGFIAAAMSTFDSTINAGASYWVCDIYQAFLNPKADQETLVRQSWLATIAIGVIGVVLAITIPDINDIWQFLTGVLSAGFFIPQVMRWYWNRHNGYGFAWGTGVGIVTAMAIRAFAAEMPFYQSFPLVCFVSFVAGVVATLASKAPDPEVLLNFFRTTRPWGFWGAQREECPRAEEMSITIEQLYDLISLVLAIPWQLSLFFGSMCFVVHAWSKFYMCAIVWTFCSIALYFTWYLQLRDPEETGEAEEAREAAAKAKAALDKEDADRAAAKEKATQRSSQAQQRRSSSKHKAVKKRRKK